MILSNQRYNGIDKSRKALLKKKGYQYFYIVYMCDIIAVSHLCVLEGQGVGFGDPVGQ